jgi:hypothetical protein
MRKSCQANCSILRHIGPTKSLPLKFRTVGVAAANFGKGEGKDMKTTMPFSKAKKIPCTKGSMNSLCEAQSRKAIIDLAVADERKA